MTAPSMICRYTHPNVTTQSRLSDVLAEVDQEPQASACAISPTEGTLLFVQRGAVTTTRLTVMQKKISARPAWATEIHVGSMYHTVSPPRSP